MPVRLAIRTAPKALPLVGHAPWLLRAPLDYLAELRELGPVVRLRLGRTDWYVITSPAAAVQVLTDPEHFDKGGPFIATGRLLVGNGVITCDEQDHRAQRPLMQPAFHRNRVAVYSEAMGNAITAMTRQWQEGQEIDVNAEMYRLAGTVVAHTLVSAPEGRPAAQRMADGLPALMLGLVRRMLVPVPWVHKLPTPANRRFTAAVEALGRAVDDVVHHYLDLTVDRRDLLSCIAAGDGNRKPGAQELRDQILTVLSAGVETSASLMAWTWHVVATHPSIEEKLWAEADAVLQGRPVSFDDIPALPYTRRVLTEVLRMYPPTWILSRYTVREATVAGTTLPQGSNVIISPHALHRDPAVFPDAGTFDPDRWLPERTTRSQKQFFLAFGTGRRRCMGELFGLTEAVMTVATVSGTWRLRHTRPGPVSPVTRFLLTPADRTMVLSRRRAPASSAKG